jgi:hypothetical protein
LHKVVVSLPHQTRLAVSVRRQRNFFRATSFFEFRMHVISKCSRGFFFLGIVENKILRTGFTAFDFSSSSAHKEFWQL